ncbi:MAG: NADH-quinone oxidoreductase subunit J [Candidatus Goldbacteria bacterium]|nr:NADH-quinone oxidoreductase subunit J [Candidatus Goldiibacteriota bacterium]
MVETILFYGFAALILISALLMVFAPNIYHSALFLALSLFGVAGIYVVLNSYFLAGIQVLVYIGAVVVLSLFVINLTRRIIEADSDQHNEQLLPAVIISALTAFLIISAALKTNWGKMIAHRVAQDNTALTGRLLLNEFVVPFEVVSVLLLAALIGAIAIVAGDKKGAAK